MNTRKITLIFLMVLFFIGIGINTIPAAEARVSLTKSFKAAATGAKIPMAARSYKIATTTRIGSGSFARSTSSASTAYKSGAGAGSMATVPTTSIGQGTAARTWAPAKPLPPSTLHTRGIKPAPGERTFQGLVNSATKNSKPTIQRNGQDLFRLRPSGHGQIGATATPQNVFRTNKSTGQRFGPQSGPDRAVTKRDIRELYKAQTGHGNSTIRTRSGR